MFALCAIFLTVLVATAAVAAAILRGMDFWYFFSIYLCLFLIFVQVFSVGYKSISLRLIFDIHEQKNGRATLDWVYGASIVAGSFQRRLSLLEQDGLISRRNDGIALTPKGRQSVQRLVAAQKLLGIGNSG
jgi:predicted transcriptional regulator